MAMKVSPQRIAALKKARLEKEQSLKDMEVGVSSEETTKKFSTTKPVQHSFTTKDENRGVTVTNIQMPFGSMVIFMIKWVIASIPAAIIFCLIAYVVFRIILKILAFRTTLGAF